MNAGINFSMLGFVQRQLAQIRTGGWKEVFRKIGLVPVKCAGLILAVPAVATIRLIRPWLLVRLSNLVSASIGNFAINTELYLCERDAEINRPQRRHVDLFYAVKPVCNQQLLRMWKRILSVWPAEVLRPIIHLNRLLPGSGIHEIGGAAQYPMDIHNLLDRFPPHPQFTNEESSRGPAGLRAIGVPEGARFVCLISRDSAYLNSHQPGHDWSHHDFRDSDIQNYVLAAEALTAHGYYVIRMGAKVRAAMKTSNPMIIDYAANGMRSDFMDIYLGSQCAFCVSSGTGWDEVPQIFRRPCVFVNTVTLGYLCTSRSAYISIPKAHVLKTSRKPLTLREIFSLDAAISQSGHDYASKGIDFIENTPEEIRDVALEMVERLNGTWRDHPDDHALQKRVWQIYPKDIVDPFHGRPLHGEIRARIGAAYLRNNRAWLE